MHVHVIPVLYPQDDEILHPTVREFMATNEFSYYVDDGEVCHCFVVVADISILILWGYVCCLQLRTWRRHRLMLFVVVKLTGMA